MEKLFEIDGLHIKFNCCGNTLAIQYNENDDLSKPKACPFCGMKFEDANEFVIDPSQNGTWSVHMPESKEVMVEYFCSVCGHVISLRPAMIQRFPKHCPKCMATMN